MTATVPVRVAAPAAPGSLGAALAPAEALTYLEQLRAWHTARGVELDALDRTALSTQDGGAALAPAEQQAVTADLTLAMALWQAVGDRLTALDRTWDSGRVGEVERRRLADLVWGRLDDRSGPLAVSVPEACRLSDALAAQLAVRLRLEASGLETADRLRALRAQLERIRDQVRLEPPAGRDAAGARLNELAVRVSSALEKHGRGADVGGLLGPIEITAATMERDLIVGSSKRSTARALVQHGRDLRARLCAREPELTALVARTVARIDPAPRYAVPDVDALGPLPNTTAELEPYLVRMEQVGRAMDVVQQAYAAALAEHATLTDRLDALLAAGPSPEPAADTLAGLARAELDRRPTRLRLVRPLLELLQTYVEEIR